MKQEFKVTGLEELMDSLKAMTSPDFADNALRKGLAQGGKLVQGTAKGLCPVDTGQLRNSIEVTSIENGADVGTNVEYAAYVEYGTGKKGDPSVEHREDWEGQAPQPYLYPALEAHKAEIKDIVQNTLQEEIRKAVR